MSNTLEFSTNWNNKLDCRSFTTLRLSGRFNIGDDVQIYLKKYRKGTAKVLDKKKLYLHDINEYIAQLDTALSANECKMLIQTMYKDVKDWNTQPIYFYLLRYNEKETDFNNAQQLLL